MGSHVVCIGATKIHSEMLLEIVMAKKLFKQSRQEAC